MFSIDPASFPIRIENCTADRAGGELVCLALKEALGLPASTAVEGGAPWCRVDNNGPVPRGEALVRIIKAGVRKRGAKKAESVVFQFAMLDAKKKVVAMSLDLDPRQKTDPPSMSFVDANYQFVPVKERISALLAAAPAPARARKAGKGAPFAHDSAVNRLVFVPGRGELLTIDSKSVWRRWSPTGALEAKKKTSARFGAWSPDGRHFVAGNASAAVFDTSTLAEVRSLSTRFKGEFRAFAWRGRHIAFEVFASLNNHKPGVAVCDEKSGKPVFEVEVPYVNSLGLSDDGSVLFVLGDLRKGDGLTLFRFELPGGQRTSRVAKEASDLHVSGDAVVVATAGGVEWLDAKTLKTRATLAHQEFPRLVDVAPDGRVLVAAGNKLFTAKRGAQWSAVAVEAPELEPSADWRFAWDGERIAVAAVDRVRIVG